MPRTSLPWGSSNSNRIPRPSSRQLRAGPADAAIRATPESSVPTAANRSHSHRPAVPGPAVAENPAIPENSAPTAASQNRPTAGYAPPAAPKTRASSVSSAAARSLRGPLCINAINVAGSLRIPRIRQNSVPSAEIPLMTMTGCDVNNGRYKCKL